MKHIFTLLLFTNLLNATPDCIYDVWESRYARLLPKDYKVEIFIDNDYSIIMTKDKLSYVGSGKTLDDAFNELQKEIKASKLMDDDNDN